jgi:hypothetical protein
MTCANLTITFDTDRILYPNPLDFLMGAGIPFTPRSASADSNIFGSPTAFPLAEFAVEAVRAIPKL